MSCAADKKKRKKKKRDLLELFKFYAYVYKLILTILKVLSAAEEGLAMRRNEI
jgi:hypothetical protein